MAPSFQAQLLSITEVANNTVEVRLRHPKGFEFVAGQYVSLVLNEVDTGKITDEFHEFSIASSPNEPYLAICTRRSNSPFKSALLAKQPGDTIEVQGPFGNFVLPDKPHVQLIAGGVGITPFHSMIFSNHETKISLWYFNTSPESAAYLDQLKQKVGDNFTLHAKFQALDEQSLSDIQPNRPVMIAGPPGFVKKARESLTHLGILDQDMLSEEFTGYDD